jgi:transcriptional regulator GlxA family with amidase domain
LDLKSGVPVAWGIMSEASNRHGLDRRRHDLPIPVQRALEIIDERHSGELRLGEIAEEVSLSKYHLSRLFRKSVGMSFQQYLTAIRVEKACRLLASSPVRLVTEVAFEAGFGSLRNMENHFRRLVGLSPAEYSKAGEKRE